MLRERLSEDLTAALKGKDSTRVSTLRLILAALKDRDIAARSQGKQDPIPDGEILAMLQSMVKQRRESIAAYEKGGRLELARVEADEIAVIESFLPARIEGEALQQVIDDTVDRLGATNLKDMGRVMASLKESHAGSMDFSKASAIVKARLS